MKWCATHNEVIVETVLSLISTASIARCSVSAEILCVLVASDPYINLIFVLDQWRNIFGSASAHGLIT